MSEESHAERPAVVAAEEVLREIFGDDLQGCTVSMERIGAVIEATFGRETAKLHELVGLYEKLVEALHLLSTPPEEAKTMDANELRSLLGDRLDAIQTLTAKAMATTSGLNSPPDPSP